MWRDLCIRYNDIQIQTLFWNVVTNSAWPRTAALSAVGLAWTGLASIVSRGDSVGSRPVRGTVSYCKHWTWTQLNLSFATCPLSTLHLLTAMWSTSTSVSDGGWLEQDLAETLSSELTCPEQSWRRMTDRDTWIHLVAGGWVESTALHQNREDRYQLAGEWSCLFLCGSFRVQLFRG